MKCLRKYKWVKLPRKEISKMKGRMGFWLRLADQGYKFDVADAWLDLWCHTVFRDYGNAFSFLSPVVQYGKYGSMLTLETLGSRWDWEKTKVWRFFRKYPTCFQLYRLPNSYGCVIYSQFYPTCDEIKILKTAQEYREI